MKRKLLFVIILFISAISFGQNIGINNDGSVPAPSAGLDVNFEDKGLLIPRVSLVSTRSATPVRDPSLSLLVFNTAITGDVTPGYYYWNGNSWTRLLTAEDQAMSNSDEAGTNNYIKNQSDVTQDAIFRINGDGLFDGGNVGIGTLTPGAKLDVAGKIWQTQTGYSVFIGEGAGTNDQMTDNQGVFIGYHAGYSNTSGKNNSAIGYNALYNNTTGVSNTALGQQSLYNNTTGFDNTATGLESLYRNSTGRDNTAFGKSSLWMNTTGYQNTAGGLASQQKNTTGYGNTSLGYFALSENITGFYNTAVGNSANVANGNLNNATAIGSNAVVGASNSLVLGGTGGWAVNVGIGTQVPGQKLDVVGGNIRTDQQVISTVAPGTAPLVVSSPTLVTGLRISLTVFIQQILHLPDIFTC